MSETPLNTTFGRRNPHCSNCGDERGGDFGHEHHECQYRPGMTAEQLAKTMSPKKASRYWSVMIDRYFERELNDQACGAFQTNAPRGMKPYRCSELPGHVDNHRAVIDGVVVAEWPRRTIASPS